LKDNNYEVKVKVGDIAFVLAQVHNLLYGISERGLCDILRGIKPEDTLNKRLSKVKQSLISILAETTENGGSIENNPTPYFWQKDDIVNRLGGKK